MSDFTTPNSGVTLPKKRDALAQALGHAISRWANIEYNLVTIFAKATGTSLKMAASILRQVKTFSLLLDMCHAAVRCRLEGTAELVYWQSLVEYARELSGDRNYMAHHALILHAPGPPESMPPELVEPKIGPNILAVMARADDGKRVPLDKTEIEELLADFQQLLVALMGFSNAFETGTTSLDKYCSPIERRRPPRNERLEALRREQGSPPAPSRQ